MTARKPRHMTLNIDPLFPFQIPGEPNYGITTEGDVYRLDSGHSLKPVISQRGGYLQVSLWTNGRGRIRYVHQLVALTFDGPRPTPKHDGAHTDGNKLNNRYRNIRWATRAENEADKIAHGRSNRGERSGTAKLTALQVATIRSIAVSLPRSSGGRRIKKGALAPVAAQYGVTQSCLRQIIYGQRWTA